MRTLGRSFVTVILAASLLLSSVNAMAQSQMDDWSKVTALSTGSNLAVKQKNGKTIKGTLSSTSDSALTLNAKSGPVEIKRDDVRAVHEVIKKGSGAKGALIGTAVGAGAGAAFGAIVDAQNENGFGGEKLDNAFVAALTVLGAGAGAITGYFIGRRGNKRVLVYEAK
jgi:hypothetical protein